MKNTETADREAWNAKQRAAMQKIFDRIAEQNPQEEPMIHASANTTADNDLETVPYVTRCYFSWPLDAIAPEIDPDDNQEEPTPEQSETIRQRTMEMYVTLANAVRERYPNAHDLWQENTGFGGNWAQFTPRADNPDTGEDDPEYFDWLTETTDRLAAQAVDLFPMPEVDNEAV